MAVRTVANRVRIIAWSRVCNDIGLTNQVCALKTGPGIQKSRWAVQLLFQSTFNVLKLFSRHRVKRSVVLNRLRYPILTIAGYCSKKKQKKTVL